MSVVRHVQRGEVYGVVRFVAPGGTDDGGSERSDQAWELAAGVARVADARALGTVGARERRPSRGAKGSG